MSMSSEAAVDRLFVQAPSGFCELDTNAAQAALSAAVGVERMPIVMREICFSYPMKKTTHVYNLLDVLVCLGEADLATDVAARIGLEVAVQGTIHTALAEWHLLGGSAESCSSSQVSCPAIFPVCLWMKGQQASLPRDNQPDRLAAAVAAAVVLDRARAEAQLDFMILLAQWMRLWRRSLNGNVELHQPTLLRHIFAHSVPDILLSLPRLKRCFASLQQASGCENVPPLGLASSSCPREAASGVRHWCKGAGVGQTAASDEGQPTPSAAPVVSSASAQSSVQPREEVQVELQVAPRSVIAAIVDRRGRDLIGAYPSVAQASS